MENIIHISTFDNLGGSGRSAYRIHRGLLKVGLNSHMLVGYKTTPDTSVSCVSAGYERYNRALSALNTMTAKVGLPYQWMPWDRALLCNNALKSADIIQLYNLHGGYFSLPLLPKLAEIAPIVWRLSDMWPATGHCVYSGDCERWKTGCGKCPSLSSYVPLGIDTTRFLWKQKESIYSRSNITIVAPSSWSENFAMESPLLNRFPIIRIPNGINTSTFTAIPRSKACEALGLDPQKIRIIFVAHNLNDHQRKGGDKLQAALKNIPREQNIELLLVGEGDGEWLRLSMPFPIRSLGFLKDNLALASAYSASDIVVVPSVVENLPNSLLEAMSCGLPVVAFDSGGICDAVHHGKNGLLSTPTDVFGFSKNLRILIGSQQLRAEMGRQSRALILARFSDDQELDKFLELYCSIKT